MWNTNRKQYRIQTQPNFHYRFFRRLTWSPDGSLLLAPAAVYQDLSIDAKSTYTVYGFIKTDLTQPAFMLPGIKSYATSIRFNPYLYKR